MQNNLICKEKRIKTNAFMAVNFSALLFVFIFLISFSSASMQVGLDGSLDEIGINFDRTPFNISEQTVNLSKFWDTISLGPLNDADATQHNNIGGTLTIDTSWVDSLWCALTGCNMTGDLNVDADLTVFNMPNPGIRFQRDDATIGSGDTIGVVSFRGGERDSGDGKAGAYIQAKADGPWNGLSDNPAIFGIYVESSGITNGFGHAMLELNGTSRAATFSGDLMPKTTLAQDIGSGALRWDWLYVGDISADDIVASGDIVALGNITADTFYGSGAELTNLNVTGVMNVSGDFTGYAINISFLLGAEGVGGMDLRGDPWWLGGTDLQIAENLIVDENITIDNTLFVDIISDTGLGIINFLDTNIIGTGNWGTSGILTGGFISIDGDDISSNSGEIDFTTDDLINIGSIEAGDITITDTFLGGNFINVVELLPDPSFDTGIGWDLGANWFIANGELNRTSSAPSNVVANETAIESGVTYLITANVVANQEGGGGITIGGNTAISLSAGSEGSFSATTTTSNTNDLTVVSNGGIIVFSEITITKLFNATFGAVQTNIIEPPSGTLDVDGDLSVDSLAIDDIGFITLVDGSTGVYRQNVNTKSVMELQLYDYDSPQTLASFVVGNGTSGNTEWNNIMNQRYIFRGGGTQMFSVSSTVFDFGLTSGSSGSTDVTMNFLVDDGDDGTFSWDGTDDRFAFLDNIILATDTQLQFGGSDNLIVWDGSDLFMASSNSLTLEGVDATFGGSGDTLIRDASGGGLLMDGSVTGIWFYNNSMAGGHHFQSLGTSVLLLDVLEDGLANFTDLDILTVGNFTGNQISGEMWNYSTVAGAWNFDIDLAGVYYNLTDLDPGYINGFDFEDNAGAVGGSNLVTKIAGQYTMSFSMSFAGVSAGGVYGFSIAHDFNPDTHRNCYARREARTDVGSVSVTCTMDLEIGDKIAIMIENENSARDIVVHTVNLNVVRIGDM